MSGDMNTSLGNGFTNAMLVRFLCSEQNCPVYGYVEGDDGLFVTDAVLSPGLYARLGFTIKMESFDDPCCASFCGNVFAASGQIIRDPRKFVSKFGWSDRFFFARESVLEGLAVGKSMSALCETPDCPIVAFVAWRTYCRFRLVKPRFAVDGYHSRPPSGHVFRPPAPSLDTRLLFARLYGIGVDLQVEIERLIMNDEWGDVHQLMRPSADMSNYYLHYVT